MDNTKGKSSFFRKHLTRENFKTAGVAIIIGTLVSSLVDDYFHAAKAEKICNDYRRDFSSAAQKVAAASSVTVNGHKPSVRFSIDIQGKEYGSFLPFQRKICDLVVPTYN
mgnify:CR=1 FL=1